MHETVKRFFCVFWAFLWLFPIAALAQTGVEFRLDPEGGGQAIAALIHLRSNSTAPAPRMPDGKPDLSGIWSPDRNFTIDITNALKPGEELPIQPWALKAAKERMSKDDPDANCLPAGVPRMVPYPWKIVQTPALILFLSEGNIHSYRQIFMDGRKHPDDLDPTWFGDSIGHWEDDTLVVDSVGFNDKFWFDDAAHPHTEQLHIVERYHRKDMGHLEFQVTIDDPGAYTRPFTLNGLSYQLVNTEIMEYVCNENNQDPRHIVGKDQRK
jgi:hypothetical protein